MQKVLAKNPADGSTIDAARANANRDADEQSLDEQSLGAGPIEDYPPRINPHKHTRDNPMMDFLPSNELAGIVEVGLGQAVSDELVEAISERYAKDTVAKQIAIESGAPTAAGIALLYGIDNEHAKNIGIGLTATGVVNGARLGITKLREMMADDDSSGDSSVQGVSNAQQRALQQRAAQQRAMQQRRRAMQQQQQQQRQLMQQQTGSRDAQRQENEQSGFLSGQPSRRPAAM